MKNRGRYRFVFALITCKVFILAFIPLFSSACGDGEDCIEVSCRAHADSDRTYKKCCHQDEMGVTLCSFVTGDGGRYNCVKFACPEAEDGVLNWCNGTE